LKNNTGFSCDNKTSFNEFNLSSIRFELYNMYIIVKHKKFSSFESIIQFLNTFNANFPMILDEKLYLRVLISIKALVNIFNFYTFFNLYRIIYLLFISIFMIV
jgi:hypothetical protein